MLYLTMERYVMHNFKHNAYFTDAQMFNYLLD